MIFTTLPLALCLGASANGLNQDLPLPKSKPELTEYAETSSLEDVISFLRELQDAWAPVRFEWIGSSAGGKQLPLVVMSDPPVSDGMQAKRMGRPVVYVQANIHGGEVEGKEAAQMLLRDLFSQKGSFGLSTIRPLHKELVLVVVPVYNADGNENWGEGRRNRPSQDGPARVGQRANGDGLDLNRDCMKARSPEMNAVLEHVYRKWDPDVVMDLHTTNGTRHGYHLTYSPPLHPNTDPWVLDFCRSELLPKVRERMRAEAHLETFDYGNASGQPGSQVWQTFGEEGRYVTNYAGLRNRIAVLSEAMSYLPFKKRIEATYWFTYLVLEEIANQRERVARLIREADASSMGREITGQPKRLGVRFEMASRGVEEVLMEKAGAPRSGMAPEVIERVPMEVFDRFRPTRMANLPVAYVIPSPFRDAVRLLLAHGIVVERLEPTNKRALGCEYFRIREAIHSNQPFQGARLLRLEGEFVDGDCAVPVGDYIVRTAQPLQNLIFMLVEPESLDGLAAWGFLGEKLLPGEIYPIYKLPVLNAPTTRVFSVED